MACYAEIGIHRDNPLSFWHETPPCHRLFSSGGEVHGWPVHEPIEYMVQSAIHKRTRRSFVLGGPQGQRILK
jgi:hypothetical protein